MTQDVEQGIAAELDARVLQRLNTLQDSVRAWLPSAAPLSVADALRGFTLAQMIAPPPSSSDDVRRRPIAVQVATR